MISGGDAHSHGFKKEATSVMDHCRNNPASFQVLLDTGLTAVRRPPEAAEMQAGIIKGITLAYLNKTSILSGDVIKCQSTRMKRHEGHHVQKSSLTVGYSYFFFFLSFFLCLFISLVLCLNIML